VSSVRRALAYSYVEKYGAYLLALGSTVVVSRLLGPAEIGVFSVGMALVGLIAVVREFGVTTYLIQEQTLNDELIRAAFTVTVGLGFGLAIVVLALAVPLGRFYGNEDVTSVIAILSLSFALTPLGSVSQSLLSRELRFKALAWIRLCHALVLAVSSAYMAWLGWGPQSLAWAAVLASLTNGVLSMAVRPHPVAFVFAWPALKRVISVGGPVTAVNILDDIVNSMPELLLGRMQSLGSAGLFSRGKGLSRLAHQLIAHAAEPVFLAMFAERMRSAVPLAPIYAKTTACVVAAGWCVLTLLIVLAGPVVLVLFGHDWLAVIPLLRWLCISAAVALLTSGAAHLLLAGGGVKDVVRAKLLALPAHVLCLLVGGALGVESMAIAMVFSSTFASFLMALAVKNRFDIGLRQQLLPAVISLPMVLACTAGAALALLAGPASTVPMAILQLAVGGGLGATAALLCLLWGTHPLKTELQATLAQRHFRP
jgi:O-antigen/teichoic acid export membrane protein